MIIVVSVAVAVGVATVIIVIWRAQTKSGYCNFMRGSNCHSRAKFGSGKNNAYVNPAFDMTPVSDPLGGREVYEM